MRTPEATRPSAQEMLFAGQSPSAFKAVAGRRSRREFLKLVAAASATAMLAADAPGASAETGVGLIDVNVSLGRWPLRRVAGDEPERLVAKLHSHGVTQAWAGSFEALLHKDLGAVNARLAEDCRRHGRGLLLPFGSVNPRMAGWEEDLRRCAEVHRMRGLRLYPSYHGYRLDDSAFARLLALAAERRLVVQVALIMEDERMMHPVLRVAPVDPAPLEEIAGRIPGLRLVLVNTPGALHGELHQKLVATQKISFEISMLEGVGGIGTLLEQAPVERVLFGSYAPLFYFEAAELKLRESPLTPAQAQAIRQDNAERLLG